MATYHFHVSQLSRGKGQTACSAAAYRAGEKIHDRYYGESPDYTKKKGIRPFQKWSGFIVEDLCPPLCHELWSNIYPLVYALQNGAELDYGNTRVKKFDAYCPDECRVHVHGELVEK